MTTQLENRKKLSQDIHIHEDVLAYISNQSTCNDPHAKRANLLIILLAAMGSVGFKGTKGINQGWRRSPCGGNDGSHYYLWWTKKHPQVNHSSSIFIRAIRHHDLTSVPLDFGDLNHNYVLYDHMPNEKEFPKIWTEDQEQFIKKNISIRLLKGTPGTGKTTSLWHAIENDFPSKLLYLTWSDRLAETARKYFDVTLAKDAIIDTINLKTFFSRLLDDDVKDIEYKYFDLKKAIADFKDLVGKKITDHQLKDDVIKNADLYYGLIRAWILGRAPWEGLRATQFSLTNQSTSELKSIPLKQEQMISSPKHDQLFKIFENEADEVQSQKVALYTEWDQVLKERLKDAKEVYESLKLTEREEIKLFPELSLAKRSLAKLQMQEKIPLDLCYERIVIDEVQDLTPIEIAVIICLCQRLSIEHHVYPHLLIAGDEGQIVRPTYFEWRELSLLLYHSLSKPFAITLQKNLRSPKLIVDLLERFKRLYELKLPKRLHASGQVAPQSDLNTECLLALTVYQNPTDLLFFLEKMASNPDVMIISLSDQIPSDLMDRIDILERVKTPTEVKGLEYATICLLNLSSTLLSLSEDFAEKDPLAYFLALNQLRVAFSRSTQNLIILEPEDNLSLSTVGELLFDGKIRPERLSFEIAPKDLKEGIFASQMAILEYLMLDDQSIDEKIAGFLREVGREFNHRPKTAWRLLDKADQLMLEHAFEDDGFQREITIYQIRIAIFHAFDMEWVAIDQNEILSVLEPKLKKFEPNGTKIGNLISQLFKWQSNEKNPYDLIEVFKIFVSFDFEENLASFKHDLGKYRNVFINALADLTIHKDHADLFDQDISRWLRTIGLAQDEAKNQARKLKRKAFDYLISEQKSTEANFIWLSEFSNSEEIEDLKRKATYLDQVKRFDEASLIWERCSEKAKAFVSYQNAGKLKDAMRLADSMEHKEKSEIERWRFILSLLETPLNDEEKNLILTQCSTLIENQKNDYQMKINNHLNQIKQLENDFIQKNQILSNELENITKQALIVQQKKEEIEKTQVEINGIRIKLKQEEKQNEEMIKLREKELVLREEEIKLTLLQINEDKSINEKNRLANVKEREDLERAKAELKMESQVIEVQSEVQSEVKSVHQKKADAEIKIIRNLETLDQSAKVETNLKKVVVGDVSFNMVYCPNGEFWMGTDDTSLTDRWWNGSKPKHKVKMNKGFWMAETQITQELWQAVMGYNPSDFKSSTKLPVENMTWYDSLVFCNKLSELEKFTPCFKLTNIEKGGNSIKKANVEWFQNANGYRLPTEAEWEYSAKAGTELIYSGSKCIDEVAWYKENSDSNTHQVKGKKANTWGLYDMSGNVWEWCMDKWDENAYQSRNNGIENPILWDNSHCMRVLRGGSYGDGADDCWVSLRYGYVANCGANALGFRLLRCEPIAKGDQTFSLVTDQPSIPKTTAVVKYVIPLEQLSNKFRPKTTGSTSKNLK